ncbi:glycosyltransferase [Cyclobacterium xiamenense]|uniref:glycosyltransferase n=1 Tax=Cyclobacterium xiamenense TaxID=1297121 RepID=UPI0021D1919F|nr:glycosyltransferase [Cyclobacterium xiamenense]
MVICCYNSAARIVPTLTHLAAQELGSLSCELLLVDNKCTDDTVSVVEKTWQDLGSPYPLILVDEPKPGLSHARKTGVGAASGAFIVFCDDDNWLSPGYLHEVANLFQKYPRVGALGGYGMACSDAAFPDWFSAFQHGYAVGKPDLDTGFLPSGIYLTGAGMAVRRELFLKLFDRQDSLLTDRAGKELSSGGDTEICLRVLLSGYSLYYSNDLHFRHFIPKSRLRPEYRDRLFQGFTSGASQINAYELLWQLKRASFASKVGALVKASFRLPFSRLGLVARWDARRDAAVIFALTGCFSRWADTCVIQICNGMPIQLW